MDYCIASLTKKKEDDLYKAYVTDCLKYIVQNTATHKNAVVVNERFIHMLRPDLNKKKDAPKNRKEVVSGIRNKLGR